MELSERIIKQFEAEGFAFVYEWEDPPGTVYDSHTHKGKVSIFVTDGSVIFTIDGKKKEVRAGERIDMLAGAKHSAIVGSNGWRVIVGEEIEGDS